MKGRLILTALGCGLFATGLNAQTVGETPMLDQGTQELSVSGTLDFADFDELDFDIDLSYGYFIRDGWEVGGRVLGADVGGTERFDFSLFTEYNFNRGSNLVPFVGVSAGIARANFDEDDFDFDTSIVPFDDESTVFGVQGGLKWFIQPYMAFTTSIGFTVSSDDIFQADDELADNLTRFRFGLRYYY